MDQLEAPQEPKAATSIAPTARVLKEWFNNHPQRNILIAGVLSVVVLLSLFILNSLGAGIAFFVPKTNYVPVYTLVNDKISQHGAIVINMPEGVAEEDAKTKVSFEPRLEGEWVPSELSDAIVYKPSVELVVGKHYRVSLALDSGIIKKDFVVDEDPAVISVFPDSTAEADLNSAITIVFNRPIVPLTTLSELEEMSVPVSISPETPGKFKWITTRTLQFIPSKSLYGSANYTVTIRPEFVSMDGLAVPGKTYSFKTKELRLDRATNGTIVYNEPINFYFNQSVDLEKTRSQITLKNNANGGQVEFIAGYGKKSVWSEREEVYVDIEDKSVVSVYPKGSIRGNANVWEFSTSYTAAVATAYSIGGDIALSGTVLNPAVSTTVTTSPILKSVSVQSEYTELASEQLFDPSGTATYSFYEDIDVRKSSIRAPGLKKVEYGKKCQESDEATSGNCAKVDDKSTLIMSVDAGTYARGENIPVVFELLINAGGYQVNPTPITNTLTVYPELRISKTAPHSGEKSASIKELTLCTNVPLKTEEAKEFYQNFKANNYLVFGRWDNAYLRGTNSWDTSPCAPEEYVNKIHYGLLPLEPYTLNASVEDVFGQKTQATLSLETEKAPRFYLRFQNLQKIYNVTTPEKTKLTYATENFDYVNASVCRLTPDSMVRLLAVNPRAVTTKSHSELPCVEIVTKIIPLTKDQWVNQYFQLDVKDYFTDPRGQYVLSFTHPAYRDEEGAQLYARTFLSVTNLAVVDKRVKWTSYDSLPDVPRQTPADLRGAVYWLSDMHTLLPWSGAKISAYQTTERYATDKPIILADTSTTDSAGFAEFPLIADVVGAAIISGDESAVVSEWADTLSTNNWQSAYEDERVYIYTDRPIYRPGQKVFIKGLYRVGFDAAYEIFRDNDVKIEVQNSKGDTILTQKVPVSAYGTFSTDVTLPEGAPLGSYYISARNHSAHFSVEEYVGAAFEAKAQLDKEEYVAGDSASIDVSGMYYFGVPLDGGTLTYSLTSQDYYFDRYTDEYFNFGRYWYDCYECGYGDTYLKNGTAALTAEGAARIELPLNFNELYKGESGERSKIMVFHGTIKDKQGKSVSFQKSFIVHRGDYYLGVKADPSFVSTKNPFNLKVKTVDIHGKPIAQSSITVTINKVGWESYKRQEVDGGFYSRPGRTLTPVATRRVSTNSKGDSSEEYTLSEPGEYEIVAQGKDAKGNEVKAVSTVYVYGDGTVDVRPTNNATLDMVSEKKDLKVGETARFIIQNPYPRAKALISIERGRIFTYEVVDIVQSVYEYSFPITADYAPNVYASVVLLSPDPGVKYGQLEFTVGKEKQELSIDIQSNQSTYLPGEKVELDVYTKDSEGRGVPASVSLSVADMSVLALKGNPKKNPLVFFFGGFPLTVTTETNIKNLLEETPIPTGTKGGDGGNPEDLAKRKRGEFRDTAYWEAEIITDSDGKAHVSFTLPDNLTTWQLESIGITQDTKLGVNYREFLAQKEVMTIPLAPRFVVPGDEFFLGAKVFNQTAQSQTLSISLESPTLTIDKNAQVRKTIRAGETETVYFKVSAPLGMSEGSHTYTLSAKNDAYDDTVERTIPITRNMTYESTATAESTDSTSASEYLYLPDSVLKDRGGLTIKTSATLALYLTDALTYLFEYPYGCSEQLASKLSALAVSKRVLSLPNAQSQFTAPKVTFNGAQYSADEAVEFGLKQIYDNQAVDGGFSYYKGLPADPHLTIHILGTLQDLKAADYSVQGKVMNRAVQYLYGQVATIKKNSDVDTLILLAYSLSRVDMSSQGYVSLSADVERLATTQFLSDKASSNTLGYLALLSVDGLSSSLKKKVFATLQNRVDIDSRGAYVKSQSDNIGWRSYETPQKNTALLLKALVSDKREYAETDNLIRWLIASRAKDGSWGSTNTSVAALDALTDYLVWKRETESQFTLTTMLDGAPISDTVFVKDTIFSSIRTFVPVSDIQTNVMHKLTFNKVNGNELPNKFYYDMSLTYYLPTQNIPPRDEGIAITRQFFSLTDAKQKSPLAKAKVGEVVRGVITIISPKERNFLSIEDYIPAGFELVNFNLATEDMETITEEVVEVDTKPRVALEIPKDTSLQGLVSGLTRFVAAAGLFGSTASEEEFDPSITYMKLYPDFYEMRDDRLFLFAEHVQPGTYTYEYYIRATTPGTFNHLPAIASDMYFPENFGRTAGSVFTVEE